MVIDIIEIGRYRDINVAAKLAYTTDLVFAKDLNY